MTPTYDIIGHVPNAKYESIGELPIAFPATMQVKAVQIVNGRVCRIPVTSVAQDSPLAFRLMRLEESMMLALGSRQKTF